MNRLLDELAARFGVTAADGIQLLTPAGVVSRPFDPGMAVLIAAEPAGQEQSIPALPGRGGHGTSVAHMLGALYPASHPVHGLSGAADATVATATDEALESGAHYLPALAPLDNVASPHGLPWLVARLRAPDGCPWDREQTHQSLRPFLLEESYEVYDALETGATPALAEELGDLLLQIVLHAQYAAEAGVFDLADVQRAVMTKIVRRHPHVFGDVVADSAADVVRNWEQIKASERGGAPERPSDESMPAAFAGLSKSLPALAYAQEMQERAASLGYDWPSVDGVLEKIAEEAAEVAAAPGEAAQREEFGDLLLVVVNLARKVGVDAEAALRGASRKFAARFAQVERLAAARQVELRSLTLDELDVLWREAKVAAR